MIVDVATLPDLLRLQPQAHRLTTPCGDGHVMVWRRFGSGPDVVLLHGGSGAWSHWVRNIEALAEQHTLWIADLPGCGESDLPAGAYDADSIHHHVAAGMAQLFGGRAVDLVGFSFGSLVSGLITADHPELVKRLVLVAPPALGMKSPPLALQSLGRKMSAQELEASVRHNLKRLMLHRPGSIDDMAVALHAANFERDRLRLRRLARTSIMSELQLRWRCPVHAVWGREDTLARQDAHRLSEVLSGCDLRELVVIDDAGHWVQYEEPAQFNAALLRLLATPA